MKVEGSNLYKWFGAAVLGQSEGSGMDDFPREDEQLRWLTY